MEAVLPPSQMVFYFKHSSSLSVMSYDHDRYIRYQHYCHYYRDIYPGSCIDKVVLFWLEKMRWSLLFNEEVFLKYFYWRGSGWEGRGLGGDGSYRLSPDYFQLNFGAMQNLSVEFKMTFTLGDQVLKGKSDF